MRTTHILIKKAEEKIPFGGPRHRWKDDITLHVKKNRV
jgi:hypothetical protein